MHLQQQETCKGYNFSTPLKKQDKSVYHDYYNFLLFMCIISMYREAEDFFKKGIIT